MSNFIAPAIHPATKTVEDATWVDHGRRGYIVHFRDGTTWSADKVGTPDKPGSTP